MSLIALIGCDDAQEDAAKYLESGKERYASGELAKASVEFRSALQADPKNAEALYHMGLIQEARGNFDEAHRFFNTIVLEHPDHGLAHAKLGQFYIAAGDLEKAREHAARAQALVPEHTETMLLDATLQLRDGAYDEAAETGRAVLAKDPENVNAAVLVARALQELGDTAGALAVLDETLEHVDDPTILRTGKVQALLQDGRFEDAIAEYQKLIEANPQDYELRLTLARLYGRQGNMEEAEAVLRQAVAAGVGGTQAKFTLADLIAQEHGDEAVEAEMLEMIEAAPDDHALRLRLAAYYVAGGQPDTGESMLRRIIEEDGFGPFGIDARLALARAALIRNDAEAAEALVAEVLGNEPTNPEGLILRAALSLAERDPTPAITDLRTVLRDQPQNKRALLLLERAYLQSGELELAEETLARAVEVDPDDTATLQRFALLKAQRGDRTAALETLERIEELDPEARNAAAALQVRASLLLGEEKWEEAEWAIRRLAELPDQEPRARYLMGVLHMRQGRQDEAIDAFEAAHALAGTAAEPVRAVVSAHLARGEPGDAVAFLREALEKEPDSPFLHNMLGRVHMQADDLDAARAALETARDVAPEWVPPYANLARLHVREGDVAGALEVIQAGLAKRPDDPALLTARGETLGRLGRYDEAIETFLQLVEASPDNLVAANNAAALIADYAYDDPARLARAQELVDALEDVDNPLALDTVGWVRYRAGDYEAALIDLKRAAADAPDLPQLQYHLGMTLHRLGETEAARAALAKAVAGDADYPGIDEARTVLAELDAQG